jgi:hypothetical protein
VYWVTSLAALQELAAVAADLLRGEVQVDRVVAADEDRRCSAEYVGHLLGLLDAAPSLAPNLRDRRRVKPASDQGPTVLLLERCVVTDDVGDSGYQRGLEARPVGSPRESRAHHRRERIALSRYARVCRGSSIETIDELPHQPRLRVRG